MNLTQKLGMKVGLGFMLVILSACESKTHSNVLVQPQIQLDATSTIVGQRSEDGRTESFLGVPFAQPPVDDLRWAPPLPLTKIESPFNATNFAPACMQADRITQWYKNVVKGFGGNPDVVQAPAVSEDCLYLNIWRPTQISQSGQSLPVIVYIHGGSNKAGWSYEPNYMGHNMAADGVIVISIAYRLGALGFFSHPEFEHSNFGLLDMVEALQWINRNIDAIGGDASRITLMGESAGAGNIDYLMAIPSSAGLFSRAIHQSSGSAITNRSTQQEHTILGIELAKTLLSAETDNLADQLRAVSAERVITVAEEVYSGHYFDVAVDGQSVYEPFGDTLKAKNLHTVELLVGSNEHESLMYLDENQTVDGWLESQVGSEEANKLRQMIDHIPNGIDQLNSLSTAASFMCPALTLAEEISKMEGTSWFYFFNRQREGEVAASMGAYHGAELPYIFDTHDDWLPTSKSDRELTQVMKNYWVNFAKTGDPNQANLTEWPVFTAESPEVLILGDRVVSSRHPNAAMCKFLGPRL